MKKLVSSTIKLLTGIAFLLVVFSISNSCTKKSDSPGLNEVLIQDMAFNPGTITIDVNTTITWNNKDGIAHTVTSNTGVFDSGTINANGTYSRLFSTTGTFPYHCSLHPSMIATVIVN